LKPHDLDYHEEIEDIQMSFEINGDDTLLSVIINGEELPEDEAKAFIKGKKRKGLRKLLKMRKNK
tara:strand:- start:130 stop:324 length:195 start_codon:yes stop_codon:yes gene_type:complete